MTYQKIPGPFKRDPETNKLTDEWSSPDLGLLASVDWIWTEKVDGTNIRVIWDGYRVTFAGRTDNAQIPPTLLAHLEATFGGEDNETLFEQKFGETPAVLYGEGYGPKIQNGGHYRADVSFILFDVKVGPTWLLRPNVEDVAAYFGIDVVPVVACGPIDTAITRVRGGQPSSFGDFPAEGLVGTTTTGLHDRLGHRLIVKVKARDFGGAS